MRYAVPVPRILALALLFLCLTVAGTSAAEQKAFPHLSRVVDRSRPAMVLVRAVRTGPNGKEHPLARNTGFFTSEDGEVVTSLYVWVPEGELVVIASDGRRSRARIVGVDQHTGLALLQTKFEGVPHLRPAPSQVRPGGWVVTAVARSGAGEGSIHVMYNPGKLSATKKERRICGVKWNDLLAIDVPVLNGGAGAPVLDQHGRVSAVILAAELDKEGKRRALALGPRHFRECLEAMRKGGRRTGWLGVVLTCRDDNKPGARVQAVLPGSPADAAGLRRGDMLVSVDDEKITCAAVLERSVVRRQPGTTVQLSVRREGETKNMRTKLQARPLHIPE